MLKRTKNFTSLLIFVAAVSSAIPVYADDIQAIDTKQGTIYNACAQNSNFYIDGEINGKDEEAYWVTADGQFSPITGLNVNDPNKFSALLYNRYIEILNTSTGDLDTYIDTANNNSVMDETLRTELEDDEQRLLRSKIKKDDDGRFLKSDYDSSDSVIQAVNKYGTSSMNKFVDNGSGLSMYLYHLAEPFSEADKYTDTIYSDKNGKYVDADYNLGSLKVGTTTGASVTIKNTDKTYELKDGNTTYELRAVISNTQNSSYGKPYVSMIGNDYYRWADISIYRKVKGADDSTYTNATSDYIFEGKYKPESDATSVTVFQEFSNIPATDKIDGINYPKSSTIYFAADEDGNDVHPIGRSNADAQQRLGLSASKGAVKLTGNAQGWVSAYLCTNDPNNKVQYAENLQLKVKDGYHYMKLSNLKSIDVAYNSSIQNSGGTVYNLSDGYIEQYDGTDFAKLYKVDAGMDSLSVSGIHNMIAWSQDKEIYSMINDQSTTTEQAVSIGGNWVQASDGSWSFRRPDGADIGVWVKPSDGVWSYDKDTGSWSFTKADQVKTDEIKGEGWLKDADGTWSYGKADGTKAKDWIKNGNYWYYLNKSGEMQTGWLRDGDNWYYLNKLGQMQTGWINDNGNWYYLDNSGAMAVNTEVDGYVLDENGVMVK